MLQNIVVFTGAGISAESGLGTFRDSGGLWEQFKIEDVATLEAFERNPELVLNFYNLRRKQLLESEPNAAHISLNKLSEKYNLQIITQNIDDLQERSGSENVLHLHGKLMESKSSVDNSLIYPIEELSTLLLDSISFPCKCRTFSLPLLSCKSSMFCVII
jgi:NAD-dependent deacetylase